MEQGFDVLPARDYAAPAEQGYGSPEVRDCCAPVAGGCDGLPARDYGSQVVQDCDSRPGQGYGSRPVRDCDAQAMQDCDLPAARHPGVPAHSSSLAHAWSQVRDCDWAYCLALPPPSHVQDLRSYSPGDIP